MIKYTPYPVLFSISGFHIYTFSLFLSVGMLVTYLYARREVLRSELDPDFFTRLAVYTLVGAFLGARVYVIAPLINFTFFNFKEALLPYIGGSSIGGFLGAMAAAYSYAAVKKMNYWQYADAAAPALLLGISIVRIGCFLNWDDYGTQCALFWGVLVDGYPRHPTQIYESLFSLILFSLILYLKQRKPYHGWLFLIMVLGYSTGRFLIEFLRDSTRYWVGLTATQIIMIFVVAGSLSILSLKKFYLNARVN